MFYQKCLKSLCFFPPYRVRSILLNVISFDCVNRSFLSSLLFWCAYCHSSCSATDFRFVSFSFSFFPVVDLVCRILFHSVHSSHRHFFSFFYVFVALLCAFALFSSLRNVFFLLFFSLFRCSSKQTRWLLLMRKEAQGNRKMIDTKFCLIDTRKERNGILYSNNINNNLRLRTCWYVEAFEWDDEEEVEKSNFTYVTHLPHICLDDIRGKFDSTDSKINILSNEMFGSHSSTSTCTYVRTQHRKCTKSKRKWVNHWMNTRNKIWYFRYVRNSN